MPQSHQSNATVAIGQKWLTGKGTETNIAAGWIVRLGPILMNLMRGMLCWIMIALVPASMMAADTPAGMAHLFGTAWLNGAPMEQSSPIFSGDLVQTDLASALKISSSGSSVTVFPDSVVKFEGAAVQLERGTTKLISSTGMSVRAGNITATPIATSWTEFKLTHVNGEVQIFALKGDLQLNNGSETTNLSEGQEATQKDSDDGQSKEQPKSPVPAAKKKSKKKAILILASAGAAAATGTVLAVVANSSGTPRVISPVTP